MKNILLPTDFSEAARNAICYAVQLFSHTNCRFILLNVFQVPQSVGVLISVNEILAEDAQKALDKEMRLVLERLSYPQIKFESMALPGSFHEMVGHVVKNRQIDLVVMGTLGAGGMVGKLLGSNTARVLREVPCPVLAVPYDTEYRSLRSVVFASDGESVHGYPGQWETLASMMSGTRPNFTTLHVTDPETAEDEKWLRSMMQTKNSKAAVAYDTSEVTAYHTNVTEGIKKYVLEHSADMLVMVAHRYNWFERIFHHSVTQDMVMQNLLPIMVMQERVRATA
jgi:nucleotide-binding universal stress UspA family protein